MPDTAAIAPTASTRGDVTHGLIPTHPQSMPSPVRDWNPQNKLSGKPSPPYPPPTPPPPPPSAPLSPVSPLLETSPSFPSASSGRLRSIESGGLLRPSSSRRNPQQSPYSNSPARLTTVELRCLDSLAATVGSGGSGVVGTSASLNGAFHNHATQEVHGGSGGGTNDRRRGVYVLGVAGEGSDTDVDDVDVNGKGKGDGDGVVGSCCGCGKRCSDSERPTSKATLKQSWSYVQSAATRPGAGQEDYRLREAVGGGGVIGGGGYVPIGELPRTGHLPPLTFSISTPAAAAAAISPDPRAANAATAAAAAAAAASSQHSTLVVDNDAARGTSGLNIEPNNTITFCQ
ncbi:hypothetical protein Vafri_1802 [Volvox africanus]|nr:hypothetical protein Vafri_1802 [Volvox africanus]